MQCSNIKTEEKRTYMNIDHLCLLDLVAEIYIIYAAIFLFFLFNLYYVLTPLSISLDIYNCKGLNNLDQIHQQKLAKLSIVALLFKFT